MDGQNGKRPEPKKQIRGFRTRYFSKHVNVDISIPEGAFRRLKTWMDEHWKLAAWRACITIAALFPTIYGVSLGNMTIADKTRLSALESKVSDYDRLDLKFKDLESKAVGYDARLKAAEDKITGYQELSESDGAMLLRQEQRERDRQRRRELEEHNKARAEKLKRIGQGEELRANPSLPPPSTYPKFRGVKND